IRYWDTTVSGRSTGSSKSACRLFGRQRRAEIAAALRVADALVELIERLAARYAHVAVRGEPAPHPAVRVVAFEFPHVEIGIVHHRARFLLSGTTSAHGSISPTGSA